ncbi:hypothetical protein UAW_01607 [Enterococcus haemoperoxidus ATCC BAA-382]|uniref:Uncharacterized protein n=1 Tax=Enterococcus haemoperoxidus ATCC BAA-382 TaxID=1158608 RepID=R2SPI3_9ENTE|nr:hypothetical protein UAW_01607 [Enterococcus haemoperoxidus ATCC BAA-382]EOT59938.1 hypothetical protein I583_02573 [Enterococcus haemoperoxidus ATCC BAA-382]OJG56119.1 hypothetical protein RV06_GL000235 [Enterococcus haemoperoxidus]
MERVIINKKQTRDTATIPSLGMLAYRIFPDTECINIQLLSGAQEECTIPFKDGEMFSLRDVNLQLDVVD